MPAAGWTPAKVLVRVLVALLRPAPRTITLDQLRSDLSHEPASKLARLGALSQQWRAGDRQPGDAADAARLVADLEALYLRHARLGFARFGTLGALLGALAALGDVRECLRRAAPPRAGEPALAELAGAITRLRAASQALVEALTSRVAARLGDLARGAVDEIRCELGRDDARGVAVAIAGADAATGTWVPRRDAATWRDIVRNLVRNGVQASEDRHALSPGMDALTVSVRLVPSPGAAGSTLEVADDGVGMSPAQVDAMWRVGTSSHGPGRGQGLTEGKREFVARRAALEVRSALGVGTCVRLDVPYREILVPVPRPWTSPAFVAPLLLLAGVAGAVATALLPERDIARVIVTEDHIVRALDGNGAQVWWRDVHEKVRLNYLATGGMPRAMAESLSVHLVLRDAPAVGPAVVVGSVPDHGPGHLTCLGEGGRTLWRRTLHWVPPVPAYSAILFPIFEVEMPWLGPQRVAIAANVRAENYSSTSIQFFSPSGDSLAAYYHPGNLEFLAAGDVNGDGHPEILLGGLNNRAHKEPEFARNDLDEYYAPCVVMLSADAPNGQGYPYRTWPGMPRATEEGYLVLPPVRWRDAVRVQGLTFERTNAPGPVRAHLVLTDGRLYALGADLRPLSCDVGDYTTADTLHYTHALGPVLWIHRGVRECMDVPIGRGP